MDQLAEQIPGGVLSSLILIAVLLAARNLALRYIRKREGLEQAARRRLNATARNVLLGVAVFGLIVVWLPQLSSFALSMAAFAVAFVIATKELLLNLAGMTLRIASQPFTVGDWIEIDGRRGEVIDEGAFSFRLQELDKGGHGHHFTGRTVTVPNALLLTHPVVNENFYRRYVFHSFRYTLKSPGDPEATIAHLESVLAGECAEFADVAGRYWSAIRQKSGIDLPPAGPQVAVRTTDQGLIALEVSLFCPSGRAEAIEATVNRALWVFEHARAAGEAGKADENEEAAP